MNHKRTSYKHIWLDDRNVPVIARANMKVVELVTAKIAYGWSPEELKFQFPHLPLAQIYSALAYYADHQADLERDMAARAEAVERLRQTEQPPAFIA